MPVYKNDKNGTWYVMVRYKDWRGDRKQKCQRGFATKREAQEWERQFLLQKSADIDMTLVLRNILFDAIMCKIQQIKVSAAEHPHVLLDCF